MCLNASCLTCLWRHCSGFWGYGYHAVLCRCETKSDVGVKMWMLLLFLGMMSLVTTGSAELSGLMELLDLSLTCLDYFK